VKLHFPACSGLLLLFSLTLSVPAFAQFEFNDPQYSAPVRDEPRPADPRSRAKIHTELGALYFQAGSPAAALDHLARALELDSTYIQANSVRGLVYASLRENDKAEADFARALARAPNDPEVNNNYGWFLCETGRARQSIPYFQKALRDPLYETPDRAYTNAGNCLLSVGDLDAAQGFLLQAIQASRSGAVQAKFGLARLLYTRGNWQESLHYLNEAMRLMDPPSAEALWLAVRLGRKSGQRSTEHEHIAQLRNRYPTSPEYQEFLKGNFQ
jgi:type IV pilus assembly protein PilF